MEETDQQVPLVVIVGAGPTGLALAIELGMRSIQCLVLERDVRSGFAPRAKTTHVRTRELMRRWGIADALADASPFGVEYPTNIHFVTRLNGYSLVRFDEALNCSPQRDDRYAEHGQWVPQYKLEAVLRAKAAALPSVQIRNGATFIGIHERDTGVDVCVQDARGDEQTIWARYLVGADGARSAVREAIGATMVGAFGLSRNYNIIFEAPGLNEAHPHGPGVMYWQVNPEIPSVIGPMDKGDIWYFGPTGLGPDVLLTDEEATTLIRKATGIDLPYRVLSSEIWTASRLSADRYRRGPALLAGDACHLHPPFGGFGMNMGIADGVDLGWKLAAMIQGWGGPALLDSYEIERRPIHNLVMDEAEGNHAVLANQLFREGIEEDSTRGDAIRLEVAALIRHSKEREFRALGIIKGLRYRGSPVIFSDGTENDWQVSRDYVPSAAPGSIAPHAWLADGRSLYDLFGDGFTLLVFDAGGDDVEVAATEALNSATPMSVVRLPEPSLAALYGALRALVRPDQIVAWRGDAWPSGEALLELVSGRAGQAAIDEPCAAIFAE